MIGASARATRFCMPMNEYQRRCLSFFQKVVSARTAARRSMVTGWWIVARVGIRRLRAHTP